MSHRHDQQMIASMSPTAAWPHPSHRSCLSTGFSPRVLDMSKYHTSVDGRLEYLFDASGRFLLSSTPSARTKYKLIHLVAIDRCKSKTSACWSTDSIAPRPSHEFNLYSFG